MDRTGIPYLFSSLAVLVIGILIGATVGAILVIFGVMCAVVTIFFFRDPNRKVPTDKNAIVSPADGRVISTDDVHNAEIGDAKRICIFMSPFNVHINRSPTDGSVVNVRHFSGKFHRAFMENASLENEHTDMLMHTSSGKIIVKQIAGIIARRIVCRAKEGDRLCRGQKYGIIHFGSRVELLLPENLNIVVEPGQKVKAGETIVATGN